MRVLLVAAVLVLITGCSGPAPATEPPVHETFPPTIAPAPQPTGTPVAVAPATTGAPQTGLPDVRLVALSDSSKPEAQAGYQDVTVAVGLQNAGTTLAIVGDWYDQRMIASFSAEQRQLWQQPGGIQFGQAVLDITEGRTYQSNYGLTHELTAIPPGVTVCGVASGDFDAAFVEVPTAAHPSAVVLPPGYQADLANELGKCPTPDTSSMPTSIQSPVGAVPGAPGFSVGPAAGPFKQMQQMQSYPWVGASVQVTNNAPLDPLDFAWVSALTDTGHMVFAQWVQNSADCGSYTGNAWQVGPGQSVQWIMCAPSQGGMTGSPTQLGKPVALLFVAADGSYGLMAVPN